MGTVLGRPQRCPQRADARHRAVRRRRRRRRGRRRCFTSAFRRTSGRTTSGTSTAQLIQRLDRRHRVLRLRVGDIGRAGVDHHLHDLAVLAELFPVKSEK